LLLKQLNISGIFFKNRPGFPKIIFLFETDIFAKPINELIFLIFQSFGDFFFEMFIELKESKDGIAKIFKNILVS
jgi:hypothetical protein